MTTLITRDQACSPDANSIHIGLVNNMPAPAMQATERQFRTLLNAASENTAVRLSLFALPEIQRPPELARRIDKFYSPVESLWKNRLDGLIVTGTEPRVPLRDEPYWGALSTLVDWAGRNTCSSIWSCLAAHAAVARLDGIDRQPLASKRFGIFESRKAASTMLTTGLAAAFPDRMGLPHSRWNDIPNDALRACGYHALTQTEEGGVDVFVKQTRSLFIFFQGHPEYDADTLLLEYRRDVRRFLRRERDVYPDLPQGYIDECSAGLLTEMRERALADRREKLLENFPFARLAAGLKNTWRPAAVAFYRNWLRYLAARRSAHTPTQKKPWQLGGFQQIPGPLLKTSGIGGYRADRHK
jgi:homoserine O-succinyltransferase/O-acetyltransferase